MIFKDPEETYSLKEKLAVAAVLLLPVALAVVYAVVMRYPDTFVKAEGRIMLMI